MVSPVGLFSAKNRPSTMARSITLRPRTTLPSCVVAISMSRVRRSTAAVNAAEPSELVNEAPACIGASGRPVSPIRAVTFSIPSPSESAVIWRRNVALPVPMSVAPDDTCAVPFAETVVRAWARRTSRT